MSSKKARQRRGTVPQAAAPGPAVPHSVASSWIISPWWDSVLFIGAPLVCMATLLPLSRLWTSEQTAVFLLAFFTFGHHFPGFVRTYGDRELFDRYRWRFLLAPPLVFATALWFDLKDLHGLVIFVSAWDIWHVLMQHYGFMRIYDAKQGVINPVVSRMDWAVSISWYLTLIIASPHYRHNLLSRAYAAGLPLISSSTFAGLQNLMLICTATLTLAYVGYHLHLWRAGRPVSFRKLTLLGIFLSATYFLYVYVEDFIVGFCIWSAFHCIQYYGIVWAFNRNRVDRKSPLTSFVRFLFRPGAGLVVLYLGLIAGYGSLNYLVGFVADETWHRLLIAFVFTSNALHYYYDGFIWKLREPDTRQDLNIARVGGLGEKGFAAARSLLVNAAREFRLPSHGLVQAAYLSAIVIALVAFEGWAPHRERAIHQSLVALAPEVGEAHYNLGNVLWSEGNLEGAVASYREALGRMSDTSKVHNNLGGVYYDEGRLDEAIQHYEQALATAQSRFPQKRSSSPLMPSAPSSLTANPFIAHSNLADALARKGRRQEALQHYQQALQFDPNSAKVHANLGATLAELENYQEGIKELERALSIDPGYINARLNLASILVSIGEMARARSHYQLMLESSDERAHIAARAALAQLPESSFKSN
jgi:tetratricopeptide (TPR) repeat protein